MQVVILILQTLSILLQLQQRALEVDSSRVSSAIQNLINSWKASDTQADQEVATSRSGSQVTASGSRDISERAQPSTSLNPSEQSSHEQLAEDDQQQERRNRLMSLFSRAKNGQQQPEELMPLRVCCVDCGTSQAT